ncbi:MAG: hypothetical protein JXR13_16765 [Thalassovita sp.]
MKNVLFVFGLLLAGCSAADPAVDQYFKTTNPTDIDPANIVARLDVPTGLAIPTEGFALNFAAHRSDIAETLSGKFFLAQDQDMWRLHPQDLPKLRALQAQTKAWKEAAPDTTKGSLNLSIAGCRTAAPLDEAATVSASLSMDGGDRFLPVIQNMPLRQVINVPTDSTSPSRCAEAIR